MRPLHLVTFNWSMLWLGVASAGVDWDIDKGIVSFITVSTYSSTFISTMSWQGGRFGKIGPDFMFRYGQVHNSKLNDRYSQDWYRKKSSFKFSPKLFSPKLLEQSK